MNNLAPKGNIVYESTESLGLSPLALYSKHELTQPELADLLGVATHTAFNILQSPDNPKYLKYRLACAYLDQLLTSGKLKLIRKV